MKADLITFDSPIGRYRVMRFAISTLAAAGLLVATSAFAQESQAPPPIAPPQDSRSSAPPPSVSAPPAGSSAPAAAAGTVAPGTRFLVRLDDELSTGKSKVNKKFRAHTMEPIQAADGTVLPPGAEVRGHVSRIEPAGITGRAKLWLSFDDIKVPGGRMPLIADVSDVPGEHSVKQGESKEGEIEARTSKGTESVQAAAVGAAVGAAIGASAEGGKGAGIGAALGAVAGFLVSSGMGQELDLPKGTKLELELNRPLYIVRE